MVLNSDKTIIGKWKTVFQDDMNGVVSVDSLKFTYCIESVGFIIRDYIIKGDSLFFYNINNNDTVIISRGLVEIMDNDNMKISYKKSIQFYERIQEEDMRAFIKEYENRVKDVEVIEKW
tara:strand:- start:2180 stop:2536 length:357 start_codon:yes stop_codon:yes gene_type:complete